MATYIELRNLYSDDTLKNRLDVAIMIAAHALLTGTPTLEEQRWSASVLANPRIESEKCLKFLLAANKDATPTNIQTATDATIQTQVNIVVPSLVAASG